MEYAVRVKNVFKKYTLYEDQWGPIKEIFSRKNFHNEFFALKDISINFPKGESIGVLGRNGSGKSTLLKIITGIAEPTSGTVEVNGSLVFLDVSSGIDPELSGYENIFTKGILLGYSKHEMLEKVDDIIEFSELEEFIYQPVKNYSSGMRSKLGFAISVNVDPDILIVDEALAVGDEMFRKKCMNKMNEFKELGKTIIFVSHDKNSIQAFCSKAAWIDQGELIAYGDSAYVASFYNDFMSGKKTMDSIRSEIRFNHSVENLTYKVNEEGFLQFELDGYIYDQLNQEGYEQFEAVISNNRTGEFIAKPLDSSLQQENNSFSVAINERDNSSFFYPGNYSIKVRFKDKGRELIEFPLWAGKVKIDVQAENEDFCIGKFMYKFQVLNNALQLVVNNHDRVEQQVNKIWIKDNLINIEGIAFVRGFETKEQDDLTISYQMINRDNFSRNHIIASVHKSEEITENKAFNPQGKIYNFSKYNVSINADEFEFGDYEFFIAYKMNNHPFYELVSLVWASKKDQYPSEPYINKDYILSVNVNDKYLKIEKKENKR